MKDVTVVDARMGRGKSSAAIRYMRENHGKKRFLYITPYLDEVDRICEKCDFDQPGGTRRTKSAELKAKLHAGHNISATHALFYLMDDDALRLVREKHYSLVIDENIQVVSSMNVTSKDFDIIMSSLARKDESGFVRWLDDGYSGSFDTYKTLAQCGSLFCSSKSFVSVLNPDLLRSFDEVFMLTYMFDGQYQKAYLDYYEIPYKVVGVESDDRGYKFSDRPDNPPPIDMRSLIHLEDSTKLNSIGETKTSLSKAWYDKRSYSSPEIKNIRNALRVFFLKNPIGSKDTRIWTCYKDSADKVIERKTKRYKNNFLQMGARATNEYRDRYDVAYLVNRFVDPRIANFFSKKGMAIDRDVFALSEMLQWIWRSAIRDNKPINLYVPSSRMRGMLIDWMDKVSSGGSFHE